MKVRLTKKEILATNKVVLQVGYCDLQRLLKLREPYAYTSGNCGWNADIYSCGTTAICTGTQAFGRKVPYELTEKYETLAADYLRDTEDNYEQIRDHLDCLIEEFVEEATK